MKKILLLILLLPVYLWGQESESESFNYTPKISGFIKTKWEYCFDNNTNRFDVRNSRLSVGGSVNKYVDYQFQAEFSGHGQFVFLDAYANIKPWDNVVFWFGQFTVPFSENYVVSGSQNIFANRTFLAKFVNPDVRDIGTRMDYMFSVKVPFTLQVGVFNGAGINTPEWQDSPFLFGRLIYGTMDGFRASVKYYGGKQATANKIANYGFDLRYAHDKYRIEAEYVVKDSVGMDKNVSAAYVQGAYNFPVKNKGMLKYIEPTLRTDGMGYKIFENGFDISRITAGINLGLDLKPMAVEIRFNYEYFFLHKSRGVIEENKYYHNFFERPDNGLFDKFTIELLIKF